MIVEGILSFVAALFGAVTSLIPHGGAPTWWTDLSSQVGSLWSYGAGLGAWFPWSLAGTCLTAVFSAMALGFAIRLVRIIASFFTGGGGSSA